RALARRGDRARDRDQRCFHADPRGALDGYRERSGSADRRRADVAADDRDIGHLSPRDQRRHVRTRRVDARRVRRRRLLLRPVRLVDRIPRERRRVLVHRAEGAVRGPDRRAARSVIGSMPKRRVTAALVVAGLASMVGAARADEGQPFRTRNLSPLVSIFGIPAWSNAPSEGTRVGVSVELANHYRLSSRGSEALVLDGETWRAALVVEHAFGRRAFAALELPYYRQSGGILDDVIDAWHAAFNLPDGARNRRAEDQIAYV